MTIATDYLELGVNVIPVHPKTKRPLISGWKQFQDRTPDVDAWERWSYEHPDASLGAICGAVSGGLECVDVDAKNGIDPAEVIEATRHIPRVVQRTQSGGIHIVYRCAGSVGKNQKLASRPATQAELEAYNADPAHIKKLTRPEQLPSVLIETRGEGGYFLIAPSAGYEVIEGSFDDIPTITVEEREELLSICAIFDEMPTADLVAFPVPAHVPGTEDQTRSGDDYNAKVSVLEVLQSYGWKPVKQIRGGEIVRVLRPGKTSAEDSGAVFTRKNRAYIFSTSTALPDAETLSPFSVYAYYEHGGDFKEAAKALGKMGYGSRPAPRPASPATTQYPAIPPADWLPDAPSTEAAPFIPLGYEITGTVPDYVFFSNVAKVLVRLSPAAMTEANLLTLAPIAWWESHYFGPKGFNVKAARSWLIEHGNTLGIFRNNKLRGRGVWLDAGRVVIHTGDMLIVDGKDMGLGRIPASKYIYEIGEELNLSLSGALPDEDARRFLKICTQLKWDKGVSARLLAGWCVIAPLSGLLSWRPHIWITGPAGSGKSWVQREILRPALGDMVAAFQGNSTEPGVRRTLSRDALPVAMDEMEGNGERETEARIGAMMELARGTSSQGGGGTAKANQTGGVDVQQINSCFSFASIVPQITKRADFRRFTLLTLRVNDSPDKDAHFKSLSEDVQTLLTRGYVSRLIARTLTNVKLLVANIETFSQAVSVVLGERGAGDQLGPMLAGAALLESTKRYSLEEALEVARCYESEFSTATKSLTDEEAIIHFIAQAEIRVQSGNTTVLRSVSELVDSVLNGVHSNVAIDEADRALKAHGIAIRDKRDGIAISATHNGVKKLLEKTTWAASHVAVLSRAKDAKLISAQRFGAGPPTKAVLLPLDVFTPNVEEQNA